MAVSHDVRRGAKEGGKGRGIFGGWLGEGCSEQRGVIGRLSSEFGGYGTNTTPRLVTPNAITWGPMFDRWVLLLFGIHQTLRRADRPVARLSQRYANGEALLLVLGNAPAVPTSK